MWKGEAAGTEKHQAPNAKHQRSTKFQDPKMFRQWNFELELRNFALIGAFEDQAAQRAVDWSMQKYCSVAKTLEKTAKITYEMNVE